MVTGKWEEIVNESFLSGISFIIHSSNISSSSSSLLLLIARD